MKHNTSRSFTDLTRGMVVLSISTMPLCLGRSFPLVILNSKLLQHNKTKSRELVQKLWDENNI